MEKNLKWHSGFKTKAWFKITFRKDVIFPMCLSTTLSQITNSTRFAPIGEVSQSADPLSTVWFEMQKFDIGTVAPEIDIFKVVSQIWSAMSNVYGPVHIEVQGMTCLPFLSVEKSYEDENQVV